MLINSFHFRHPVFALHESGSAGARSNQSVCVKPVWLWIGAGDLAQQAGSYLDTTAMQVHSLSRSPRTWPTQSHIGDAAEPGCLEKLIADLKPEGIVLTLVPNGEGEAGYRRGYWAVVEQLIAACKAADYQPQILFCSSTSVYHQSAGEWVDESSPCQPSHYTGQVLLACETALHNTGWPLVVLRLGGIYGPGRDYVIRQVEAGLGGGDEWTNRIHSQDAARAMAWIIERLRQGMPVPRCLLGVDREPCRSRDLRAFIAAERGWPAPQASAAGRGGNKRCRSDRLAEWGFHWNYPSYREGYAIRPLTPA